VDSAARGVASSVSSASAWALAASLILLAGCSGDRLPGAPPRPGVVADARAADVGPQGDAGQDEGDGAAEDAGAGAEDVPDAAAPDATPDDAQAASDAAADASSPDAIAPDAASPDATAPDAAPDASSPDAAPDAGPDAGGGDASTPSVVTTCPGPAIPPPAVGSCTHVPGTTTALLLRASVVVPSGLLENGQVLVDAQGRVACAACDCSGHPAYTGAARLECRDAVVSPGLINPHEHVTFSATGPVPPRTERYEHRHDWRTGRNGHTRMTAPPSGNASAVRWTELRHLLAGSTSINGSGSAAGLVRNLDRPAHLEGLSGRGVMYSTFPLGDTAGTTLTNGCAYPSLDTPSDLSAVDAYTPHVSEGIDAAAYNEFQCLSGVGAGATLVVTPKTAIIHGLGLRAADLATMATAGASLIWSPRSNLDLYGFTAPVTTARRLGVRVALGTDWAANGSMNLLRELRCASEYSRLYLDGALSERDLVDMVTRTAAEALHVEGQIGSLSPGLWADLVVFDARVHRGYRAILEAEPPDVVLVMRGGQVMYGDEALVAATAGTTGCELLDVCTRAKRVCLARDTGVTVSALGTAAGTTYPLFACGTPIGEPACLPTRLGEFTGMSLVGDRDGDGRADASDLCPGVFDPPRPMDNGAQADADGDGVGDGCDRCPLAVACP
jgi:cytosine/adenosine deaminase-related metal-dependent hydrolase